MYRSFICAILATLLPLPYSYGEDYNLNMLLGKSIDTIHQELSETPLLLIMPSENIPAPWPSQLKILYRDPVANHNALLWSTKKRNHLAPFYAYAISDENAKNINETPGFVYSMRTEEEEKYYIPIALVEFQKEVCISINTEFCRENIKQPPFQDSNDDDWKTFYDNIDKWRIQGKGIAQKGVTH